MLVQNLTLGDHVYYQAPIDGEVFLTGVLQGISKKEPSITTLRIQPDNMQGAIDHVLPSDVKEILDQR